MAVAKQRLQDSDIEQIMGNLLKFGVFTSAFIITIGAAFYLFQHGTNIPNYRNFAGEPKRVTELHSIWVSAIQGRGRSIIQLGLLVLIATPIARIVFSIIGYFLERDYFYMILTLLVLGIILYNI
jgi:uncharacterized membrane protein